MFNFEKYEEIQGFISSKNKETKIIAISKNHPQSVVLQALSWGIRNFGENKVQEANAKFEKLLTQYPDISLHMTGSLQTNKVKQSLMLFDYFHTLDREKLAIEFSKYPDLIKEKKFFIQVNTGKELNKSGTLPETLDNFFFFCKDKLKLNVVGLMCIPPINEHPSKHFNILQNMGKRLNLNKYSMGMSGDFEEAINLNSTHIRLGTVLFGERK